MTANTPSSGWSLPHKLKGPPEVGTARPDMAAAQERKLCLRA